MHNSHMQPSVAAMAWLTSLWPYHYTNLSLNLLKKKGKREDCIIVLPTLKTHGGGGVPSVDIENFY
ncbi:hypothetical protein H5410_009550 [Solanum commersonii]|uniref:Uncharacterized protein n=1 Tax=Solanum commersonii TaxID=4109 RepID=A0A9J6AJ26_SOLCO|nr:hypothetical protein H5410_009550 [Solanum commersonii]